MQRQIRLLLLVLEFVTGALAGGAKSPFVGTWEGKLNDLPAVEIRIRETGGRINGEITFPFHQRGSDGKWEVKSRHTTPMIAPNVHGKTLTFETTHHKSHGSTVLGPNVKFRMDLTSQHEARFFKIEKPPGDGPGLRLTRRK